VPVADVDEAAAHPIPCAAAADERDLGRRVEGGKDNRVALFRQVRCKEVAVGLGHMNERIGLCAQGELGPQQFVA
jgi:hypothetical protein